MLNHNKPTISREKEEYTSEDFAQELLRASEYDYSPDGSLPWEGREEEYYPNPDNEYTEEEVKAIIDPNRQETEKQILDNYSEEEIQKLIANNCQLELARRQETEKKNQEEGKDKDDKSDRKTLTCELDNKEEESNKQQRKKQKLDHLETNKALTK